VQLAVQATVDERVESAGGQSGRVITYDRLDALPGEYDAFFSENGAESFFLSLPWFRNFCANALDQGDELRIFATEQTHSSCAPVAALLTRFQRRSVWQLAPRTLHSLSNFYTSLYGPLLSRSLASPTVVESLVRAISTDKPGWDVVDLKWLDSGAPVFGELQRAFRAAGMVVQTYFSSGNWYLPANGMSFREYWDGLRSSVRNIAKSKNKKIERSGRAQLEIVTGSNGLESAIEAYERVYASSWKTAEPYPAFIPGLIQTCAEQGWLRLGVVRVDGEPAAVQLWIVNNGKAAIYKIAYDKRFADLSVGSFLTTHMMEHVLDIDRVREVDYLTGDDKYKQDWMTHRRERWGILAMNPRTLRGAMAIARHVGGRTVKRALQAIPKYKQKSSNRPEPASKQVDSKK
jgi:hypothetical protein